MNNQVMNALRLANQIRYGRADVKKALKKGEITIAELAMDPPMCIESATVYEMLCAMNRWGRERSRRVLIELGLSEWVTFGNLTPRQRKLLMDKFANG